ncbi:MAG: phosphoribosylglycinamide formyltransferase [Pseudomonadota bacterium]
MSDRRLAILISGRGSNMLALLDAIEAGQMPATPVLVLSNDPTAPGLAAAAARGVPTAAVDHRAFRGDRAAFDAAVDGALQEAGAEIVACAGFMRIMTERLIEPWAGRMVNIHPSLLPAFRGLDTHARALAAGCAFHGCTVHEVTLDLDAGRILGQAAIRVRPEDTPDSLAARLLPLEHRLYPAVLARFIADPAGARRHPLAMEALDHDLDG